MVHISLENLENALSRLAAVSLFKIKICQLLSWPGIKGWIRIRNDRKNRFRIRIRTKSFRIHNTGFKKALVPAYMIMTKNYHDTGDMY